MLWNREPPFNREEADDAIRFMMEMDVKLDRILGILGEDDGEEED